MAYLILYFPLFKEVNPNVPAVKRLETFVLESGTTLADLLAWSTHLFSATCTEVHIEKKKNQQTSQAQSLKNAKSFATKLL